MHLEAVVDHGRAMLHDAKVLDVVVVREASHIALRVWVWGYM